MGDVRYCDLLKRGADQLLAAGIDEARSDARWLLLRAGNMTGTDLVLRDVDTAPDEVVEAFEEMIRRRINREPVSLILGDVEFMGFTFKTDERALAPRQDSERLVEQALSETECMTDGLIVDLGTGSGCLVLSFLAHRPGWKGVGLDLSPAALSLAQENADQLLLSDRVEWIEGSWGLASEQLVHADLVISNPPYIPTDVVAGLEPEVLNHDPHMALDGGTDGLTAYRDILTLCSGHLESGKTLIMEIGFDQGGTVPELAIRQGFAEIEVFRDFAGQNRVIKAVRT